jgi:hypothetical protein
VQNTTPCNHDTLRTPSHSRDPNDADYMAMDAKQHDAHQLRSPVRSRGHCIAGTEQTRSSQTTLPQTSACLRYQVSERVPVIRRTPREPPCACVHDCDHLGVSVCSKVLTDSADYALHTPEFTFVAISAVWLCCADCGIDA